MKWLWACVAVAVAVTGCSADDSLTVEAYSTEVTTIARVYVDESQSLSLRYQREVERQVGLIAAGGGASVVADAVAVVRSETVGYLALLDDAINRYVVSMSDVAPPRELVDDHESYVTIVSSVYASLPAMRDAVASSASIGDIEQALAGSGFADGQAVWTASCISLEQAIRDLGRGADLKCVRADVAG